MPPSTLWTLRCYPLGGGRGGDQEQAPVSFSFGLLTVRSFCLQQREERKLETAEHCGACCGQPRGSLNSGILISNSLFATSMC